MKIVRSIAEAGLVAGLVAGCAGSSSPDSGGGELEAMSDQVEPKSDDTSFSGYYAFVKDLSRKDQSPDAYTKVPLTWKQVEDGQNHELLTEKFAKEGGILTGASGVRAYEEWLSANDLEDPLHNDLVEAAATVKDSGEFGQVGSALTVSTNPLTCHTYANGTVFKVVRMWSGNNYTGNMVCAYGTPGSGSAFFALPGGFGQANSVKANMPITLHSSSYFLGSYLHQAYTIANSVGGMDTPIMGAGGMNINWGNATHTHL